MEIALLLVAMAAIVFAVTAIADRIDVPAPLLLIAAGTASRTSVGVTR